MKVLHINFPSWVTAFNGKFLHSLAHLKKLWKVWNLRGFILFSLALQITLIFFAPFRKQSANISVIVSIWLAYLLADYVATQAVGLIPNYNQKLSYDNSTTIDPHSIPHADILAFWSPFLLVHLGGPDTITALALEDNELWMRTALHLCTQVSATGRVFFQSLPTNLLWLPTILMFVAGILKYTERMLSLYHARLTKFKSSMLKEPDPGPNYAKLMESYDSYKKSHLPAEFSTQLEPDEYRVAHHFDIEKGSRDGDGVDSDAKLDDLNPVSTWESITRSCYAIFRGKRPDSKAQSVGTQRKNVKSVREAYAYFQKYKGLYVDMIFSFRDRSESREDFLKRGPEEAFQLIETELNFTYEVFFTKMIVIHQTFGRFIRCVSCFCQILSLVIWSLFVPKLKFAPRDIKITYILLGGAIFLDIIAICRVVLSDWSVALLNKESVVRATLYNKMLAVRKRAWGRYWSREDCPLMSYLRRVFFRRWSESVLQFNLIHYCVDPWSTGSHILFKILPIQDKCDNIAYVSKKWFADELRDFIFSEIKHKAEVAEDPTDAEDVCNSAGDWVLRSLVGLKFDAYEMELKFHPFDLYKWTGKVVEYGECLLLWHVATELLYQVEDQKEEEKAKDNPKKVNFLERLRVWITSCRERLLGSNRSCPGKEKKEDDYRKYCKTLSDYMMYLLNQQPEMMLSVAGISEVRFRDTCAEATKFFDRVLPKSKTERRTQKKACERIMQVNTEIDPRDIKGDRSKSVLFDACRLAKKLQTLKKIERKSTELGIGMWELMAKVWVELVSYSATHCRANSHAAQLKQGGELLTLVWLLMVHLGLGTQYRITQGNARSKLIINH